MLYLLSYMPGNLLFCTQVVLSFLFALYKLKLMFGICFEISVFQNSSKDYCLLGCVTVYLLKVTNTEDGDSLFLQVRVHFCQSVWLHIPKVILFIVTSMRT